jgi:hypothetical protein
MSVGAEGELRRTPRTHPDFIEVVLELHEYGKRRQLGNFPGLHAEVHWTLCPLVLSLAKFVVQCW